MIHFDVRSTAFTPPIFGRKASEHRSTLTLGPERGEGCPPPNQSTATQASLQSLETPSIPLLTGPRALSRCRGQRGARACVPPTMPCRTPARATPRPPFLLSAVAWQARSRPARRLPCHTRPWKTSRPSRRRQASSRSSTARTGAPTHHSTHPIFHVLYCFQSKNRRVRGRPVRGFRASGFELRFGHNPNRHRLEVTYRTRIYAPLGYEPNLISKRTSYFFY